MDMGRVNHGLGWVGPSSQKMMFFYSHVTGLLIKYFLTVIPNKRNHMHVTVLTIRHISYC